VINEGYLKLDINGTSPIATTITISFLGIGLLIQCIIAITAMSKMRHFKGVHLKFKILFVLSFICCALFTITLIIWHRLLMLSESPNMTSPLFVINASIWQCSCFTFVSTLLTILVLRLHVTFGESAFRMSQCTYFVLMAVMVILYGIAIVVTVWTAIMIDRDPPLYWTVFFFLGYSFAALYVIGACLAVAFFVRTLSKVAKARSESIRTERDVEQEVNQQKLHHLAARYILLFSIANVSFVVLTVLLGIAVNIDSGVRFVMFVADYTVNLLCVYLNFGFAGEHYQKCCKCLDVRCRELIKERRRRSMLKRVESIKLQRVMSKSGNLSNISQENSPSPDPNTKAHV